MKLKYRIRLAFLDWKKNRNIKKEAKINEKRLMEQILFDICYFDSPFTDIYAGDVMQKTLFEKCLQKIGLSYTVSEQMINGYIRYRYGRD